ncbi:uncharacterized protein [Aegilops tauschii subsp. strangulata]|uniref:uncharacterized protein isoform X2 n=1 Tax=Aegilops tauschii subsp. strangulata TaxID=200361 RepID=UPI001E1C9EC5|nr:antimicrobial peptides-like isoform X4 [Aegilops tauschii subsp. strangulata]
MGVKGGVGVWCLLLAGLLLLAVASAAERDTKKEKEEEIRWCKEDCDWKAGEDTGKARECKEQCERRRHGHELLQEDGDSFDRCVSKCRGHGGWWGKERWDRCRQICRQSQEGEGGDDDLDEGGGNADDRCERMCQHYHDRREKKQCMKGCKYGESGLLGSDDGHEHGDRCQTQCKRFRPGSYDRQQCVEKCQCQQKEDEEVMNHHGGGGHGHGGGSCEQKCQQRYRHEHDKQQCVRDCKSGGGGGAGGRGREGDERQHGREMVVEAILEEV